LNQMQAIASSEIIFIICTSTNKQTHCLFVLVHIMNSIYVLYKPTQTHEIFGLGNYRKAHEKIVLVKIPLGKKRILTMMFHFFTIFEIQNAWGAV